MSDSVKVTKLPVCDFGCGLAVYDGKTTLGMWANMCEAKYQEFGIGLGTGRGQRLVLTKEA